LSSVGILRTRGDSDANIRTIGAKNFEFFEIFGVSARSRHKED